MSDVREREHASFRCPSCSSTDVMRARQAFEQQTNYHRYSTVAAGVGMGGLGLGGAKTTGRSASVAALKLAPPQKPNALLAALVCVCIALFGLGFALSSGDAQVGIVIFGLSAWACIALWRANGKARRNFPNVLAAYERRWVCLRCGHVESRSAFDGTAGAQAVAEARR